MKYNNQSEGCVDLEGSILNDPDFLPRASQNSLDTIKNFEHFFREQYGAVAAKYTFLSNQQIRKRILDMWKKKIRHPEKSNKLQKLDIESQQKGLTLKSKSCKEGTGKPTRPPSKRKVLVPLNIDFFPAIKGVLKRSDKITGEKRHVSFDNDPEIRYRTASEDSSTSTLKSINRRIKNKSTNTTKYHEKQNNRSHSSKSLQVKKNHRLMSDTEGKFDDLLNDRCSWSYKTVKTFKCSIPERNKGDKSRLQIQSRVTTEHIVEGNCDSLHENTEAFQFNAENSDNDDESVQNIQSEVQKKSDVELQGINPNEMDFADNDMTQRPKNNGGQDKNKNIIDEIFENIGKKTSKHAEPKNYMESCNESDIQSSSDDEVVLQSRIYNEEEGQFSNMLDDNNSNLSNDYAVSLDGTLDECNDNVNISCDVNSTNSPKTQEERNKSCETFETELQSTKKEPCRTDNMPYRRNKQTLEFHSVDQKEDNFFKENSFSENIELKNKSNAGSSSAELSSLSELGNVEDEMPIDSGMNPCRENKTTKKSESGKNKTDLRTQIMRRCLNISSEVQSICDDLERPENMSEDEIVKDFFNGTLDMNKYKQKEKHLQNITPCTRNDQNVSFKYKNSHTFKEHMSEDEIVKDFFNGPLDINKHKQKEKHLPNITPCTRNDQNVSFNYKDNHTFKDNISEDKIVKDFFNGPLDLNKHKQKEKHLPNITPCTRNDQNVSFNYKNGQNFKEAKFFKIKQRKLYDLQTQSPDIKLSIGSDNEGNLETAAKSGRSKKKLNSKQTINKHVTARKKVGTKHTIQSTEENGMINKTQKNNKINSENIRKYKLSNAKINNLTEDENPLLLEYGKSTLYTNAKIQEKNIIKMKDFGSHKNENVEQSSIHLNSFKDLVNNENILENKVSTQFKGKAKKLRRSTVKDACEPMTETFKIISNRLAQSTLERNDKTNYSDCCSLVDNNEDDLIFNALFQDDIFGETKYQGNECTEKETRSTKSNSLNFISKKSRISKIEDEDLSSYGENCSEDEPTQKKISTKKMVTKKKETNFKKILEKNQSNEVKNVGDITLKQGLIKDTGVKREQRNKIGDKGRESFEDNLKARIIEKSQLVKNQSEKVNQNPKTWDDAEKFFLLNDESDVSDTLSFHQDAGNLALCNKSYVDQMSTNYSGEQKMNAQNPKDSLEVEVTNKYPITFDTTKNKYFQKLNQDKSVSSYASFKKLQGTCTEVAQRFPNSNIIDKTIASMKKCIQPFLNSNKEEKQEMTWLKDSGTCEEYSKSPILTEYNYSVQEIQSTIFFTAEEKFNSTKELNNIVPTDRIKDKLYKIKEKKSQSMLRKNYTSQKDNYETLTESNAVAIPQVTLKLDETQLTIKRFCDKKIQPNKGKQSILCARLKMDANATDVQTKNINLGCKDEKDKIMRKEHFKNKDVSLDVESLVSYQEMVFSNKNNKKFLLKAEGKHYNLRKRKCNKPVEEFINKKRKKIEVNNKIKVWNLANSDSAMKYNTPYLDEENGLETSDTDMSNECTNKFLLENEKNLAKTAKNKQLYPVKEKSLNSNVPKKNRIIKTNKKNPSDLKGKFYQESSSDSDVSTVNSTVQIPENTLRKEDANIQKTTNKGYSKLSIAGKNTSMHSDRKALQVNTKSTNKNLLHRIENKNNSHQNLPQEHKMLEFTDKDLHTIKDSNKVNPVKKSTQDNYKEYLERLFKKKERSNDFGNFINPNPTNAVCSLNQNGFPEKETTERKLIAESDDEIFSLSSDSDDSEVASQKKVSGLLGDTFCE